MKNRKILGAVSVWYLFLMGMAQGEGKGWLEVISILQTVV